MLTATGLTSNERLTINATPAENGSDFLTNAIADAADDFSVDFTDPDSDDTYTGQLSVALDNDDIGEVTGQIKLTLHPDPDAAKTYRLSTNVEGTKTIFDDDAPELEIVGVNSVTEAAGAVAMFRVSAEVSPNKPVTIYYTVSEGVSGNEGFLLTAEEGNKNKELNFSSGVKSVEFSIPLVSDTTPEANGAVSVTLTTDQNTPNITYTVGSPGTGSVNVIDDDSLPVVSIKANNGEIAENLATAKFELSTDDLTSDDTLMINATPAEDGADFLTNAIADTAKDFSVNFSDPDGDSIYTGLLSVVLDNDDVGEMTGDIKVTLNADPDFAQSYRLGSVVEGKATILDDDAPELSIVGRGPVTEAVDAVATFVVSAKVSPNKLVTIYYDVSDVASGSGDFLVSGEEGEKGRVLDFRSGKTSVVFTIELDSDDNSEENGDISVELTTDLNNSGLTYTVGSPNIGTVSVVDDDSLPIISIIADNGNVAEHSGPAGFMLTATGLFKYDDFGY